VELPRLEPLWNTYKDQGFAVLAIEAMRNREAAVEFIAENNLTYHLVENGEGDEEVVRRVFGVQGYPTSYILDRQGRVIYYHIGFDKGDEVKLEKEIKKLLMMDQTTN
jgi:peroxiredoxin